jgi:hypothetical protein
MILLPSPFVSQDNYLVIVMFFLSFLSSFFSLSFFMYVFVSLYISIFCIWDRLCNLCPSEHNCILLYGWITHIIMLCIYTISFFKKIYSSLENWFQSLAVVNSVAINMGLQVILYSDFCSSRYMPKSAIAGHMVVLLL